jgi:hypothetical protein
MIPFPCLPSAFGFFLLMQQFNLLFTLLLQPKKRKTEKEKRLQPPFNAAANDKLTDFNPRRWLEHRGQTTGPKHRYRGPSRHLQHGEC